MVISGVMNRFGSDVVAAYTVGGKVQQIAIITLSQIEASFAFYTGQNFGAGCFNRIQDGLKQVLILSELFGYVGAWLASPLGWVVGLTISVGYYHFGNWKQRVLSLEEK